ncbi:uncharacterized protein LOC108676459 [Hyalella azteca]|uniref:Uncharacterized protein LOC108676459 n=1 Tax=Hyalella azteca TaxID=294128 RepID=A0A8B7P233_HYAAZ|nr:uncharacterized protein LOC108676459 [Hyalella azteca]
MPTFSERKTDLHRYWIMSTVQCGAERWSRVLLLHLFSHPLLCRHAVIVSGHQPQHQHNKLQHQHHQLQQESDEQKCCIVDGAAYRIPMRVMSPACAYDALCDDVIYSESSPPFGLVAFVVVVSLIISVMVVWLPRLVIYRTKNRLLAKIQKHCRRALLCHINYVK